MKFYREMEMTYKYVNEAGFWKILNVFILKNVISSFAKDFYIKIR